MNVLGLFFYNKIVNLIPETRGFGLKRLLLRFCGAQIGTGVRVCSSVRIIGAGGLSIGNNTWVGHQTLIVCSSRVTIGNDVDIAPRVFIGTGTHRLELGKYKAAGEGVSADVEVGDGCWICANAAILPGVNIGSSSVVAAGAIVTKNVGSKALVGGVPAKIIKNA